MFSMTDHPDVIATKFKALLAFITWNRGLSEPLVSPGFESMICDYLPESLTTPALSEPVEAYLVGGCGVRELTFDRTAAERAAHTCGGVVRPLTRQATHATEADRLDAESWDGWYAADFAQWNQHCTHPVVRPGMEGEVVAYFARVRDATSAPGREGTTDRREVVGFVLVEEGGSRSLTMDQVLPERVATAAQAQLVPLVVIGQAAAQQEHPDNEAVDAFAEALKAKLAQARGQGRGGWAGDEPGMQERLSQMLRDHVGKGDPRDVAAFCMFLHQRGEAIAPDPAEHWIDTNQGMPDNGVMVEVRGRAVRQGGRASTTWAVGTTSITHWRPQQALAGQEQR